MREEINESIKRMTREDCCDVMNTFCLKDSAKNTIREWAYADENIAEYVLNY